MNLLFITGFKLQRHGMVRLEHLSERARWADLEQEFRGFSSNRRRYKGRVLQTADVLRDGSLL